MAHVLVQSLLDANTAVTSAAVGNDVAFPSNLTAGNTVVLGDSIWSASPTNVSTPTAASHTFLQVGAQQAESGGNGRIKGFYEDNVAGGACTVHFTHDAGTAYHTSFLSEHSGMAAAATLDQFVGASPGVTTTPSTGNTGTLAQADELVVGLMSHDGSDRTITEGATYTVLVESETGTNSMPLGVEYKVVAATTAVAATWTIGTGNVNTYCIVATFKLAGGVTVLPRRPTIARQAVQRAATR